MSYSAFNVWCSIKQNEPCHKKKTPVKKIENNKTKCKERKHLEVMKERKEMREWNAKNKKKVKINRETKTM